MQRSPGPRKPPQCQDSSDGGRVERLRASSQSGQERVSIRVNRIGRDRGERNRIGRDRGEWKRIGRDRGGWERIGRDRSGCDRRSCGEVRRSCRDDRRSCGEDRRLRARVGHTRPLGRPPPIAECGGPVNERLRSRVDSGEAQREAAGTLQRVGLEADHATLTPQQNVSGSEDQFEAQHDTFRARLRADERHTRARQHLELVLEIFVLVRVRTCDADRDGRGCVGGHDCTIHGGAQPGTVLGASPVG